MSTQLKQRLIFGSLAFIAMLVSIYFSHDEFFRPIFIGLIAGFISLALWEYYQLAQHKGDQPLILLGLTSSVAYIVSVYLGLKEPELSFLPHLILFLTLFFSFLAFFNKQPNPLNSLAASLFGLAYLTIPLAFILKINYFSYQTPGDDGRLWLLYVLVVSKMTDVGAFAIGKTFGKTKLIPHISPKKTVEGAIGGLIAAVITGLFLNFFLPISFWLNICLSMIISILAQFGDLAESVLKRDAGVKDSSHIPGLGGILDIVDSLVFPLPFMYFVLKMK